MGRERSRNNIGVISAKAHIHCLLLWLRHFLMWSFLLIHQKSQRKIQPYLCTHHLKCKSHILSYLFQTFLIFKKLQIQQFIFSESPFPPSLFSESDTRQEIWGTVSAIAIFSSIYMYLQTLKRIATDFCFITWNLLLSIQMYDFKIYYCWLTYSIYSLILFILHWFCIRL